MPTTRKSWSSRPKAARRTGWSPISSSCSCPRARRRRTVSIWTCGRQIRRSRWPGWRTWGRNRCPSARATTSRGSSWPIPKATSSACCGPTGPEAPGPEAPPALTLKPAGSVPLLQVGQRHDGGQRVVALALELEAAEVPQGQLVRHQEVGGGSLVRIELADAGVHGDVLTGDRLEGPDEVGPGDVGQGLGQRLRLGDRLFFAAGGGGRPPPGGGPHL